MRVHADKSVEQFTCDWLFQERYRLFLTIYFI